MLDSATICLILIVYFGLISLASMVVTICDKVRSRKGQWRVSENTLLILSALGGSVAMYLTMHIIRHKTRHIKFMVGIPIIILFQLIAVWYFMGGGSVSFPR